MSAEPEPLTGRQAEVLGEIGRYYTFLGEGAPRTYLARKLHLSVGGVRTHLEALDRKGWLESTISGAVPTPRWLESSAYRLMHLTR